MHKHFAVHSMKYLGKREARASERASECSRRFVSLCSLFFYGHLTRYVRKGGGGRREHKSVAPFVTASRATIARTVAMGLLRMLSGRSRAQQAARAHKLPPPDKPKKKLAASRRARRKVVPAPLPGESAEQTWIVLGCDHAGKSTLIAGLCGKANREDVTPTCGFSKSNATFGKHRLRVFDVGGGKGIRGIWDSYYADAHGAIFVVDATESERFGECRSLLHAAYQHAYLIGKPLLIVANKSDLPHAVGPDELADALKMHDLPEGAHRICRAAVLSDAMVGAQATDGIAPSLHWLAMAIQADFGKLQERCMKQSAEQEAADLKKKEERKARLAAKRAAREKEEAEAAAREAVASTPIAASNPDVQVDEAVQSPAPSPPSDNTTVRVSEMTVDRSTRAETVVIPVVDYFSSAASLERASSHLSETTLSPVPRRLQMTQSLRPNSGLAGALPAPLEVEAM